jgi:hypothetical protein
MRNKKAAMELSVTAIVILILAIVMLGLGLGFIRGMFTKVSTQFEEQIATEPEPAIPSGSAPISLSRESLVTHAKDSEVLKMGVYNPTNADWEATKVNVNLSCNNLAGIEVQTNSRDINQGESETFNLLFTIPSAASAQTYLCQAYITNTTDKFYTKDFTIRVTR